MALQTSGQISIGDVRNELGITGQLALGSSAVRDLFGIAGGEIRLSDGYGASLAPQWQTDLTVASYDNVSFSSESEDTILYGIAFNTDGTKMYLCGSSSDSIHQYTLSTGFDLSTASYDSVSLSVSSEDGAPYNIEFNTDGTKMYMIGGVSDIVHQYTLSTGFDLSTASYDSVSFDVTSEDPIPQSVAFNTDGTKMYMVGGNFRTLYQYTLSTGFDLTTASYDNVSFNISFQDNFPNDLTFNIDGTKMYVVGRGSASVYQYSLNTGFDISTASYDSVSFDVSSEDTSPFGLAFNTNGTKMHIVGNSTDSVYQYTTA